MNSYGNLFYMIYNAFSLQSDNPGMSVGKHEEIGYIIHKL